MKTDIETILTIIDKAQARIEELQATMLQQQAMINAVLLCLRDRTQADPKELEKLFQYYQRVVHQQLLTVNNDNRSIPPTPIAMEKKSPLKQSQAVRV
jgi:hypothetical protein